MFETWFISDLHFGHANVLQFEPLHRPFKTLLDMHEALITNWNNVVYPNDKVYVLGDFAFGKKNLIIANELKGRKRLILGNHDIYDKNEYLKFFEKVEGVKFWENCILTHVPVHPSQLEGRSDFNIHGHLHSKRIDDYRYINVSVEQINLTPVNVDYIYKLKQLEPKELVQ